MKRYDLGFACLCGKENYLGDDIIMNAPDSSKALHSINADFLNYGGHFVIDLDQWFGLSAIGKDVTYFMQADDADLGWMQMWRILVAMEGWEKFKERSEFIFDDDDFDFTAGIDLNRVREYNAKTRGIDHHQQHPS